MKDFQISKLLGSATLGPGLFATLGLGLFATPALSEECSRVSVPGVHLQVVAGSSLNVGVLQDFADQKQAQSVACTNGEVAVVKMHSFPTPEQAQSAAVELRDRGYGVSFKQ